eukprot:9463630-Pyramimonas_sp.AAC.1
MNWKLVRTRIFEDYRSRYPGLDDKELRVEMRKEMRGRIMKARSNSGMPMDSIEGVKEDGSYDLDAGVDVAAVTRRFEAMQKENAVRTPRIF